MDVLGACPLPDDPVLAATASALNDAGQWAELFDRDWRFAYLTDDARTIYGGRVEPASVPLGAHAFGPESVAARMSWGGGQFPLTVQRRMFAGMGAWMLLDTPGGKDELRRLVDPRLQDIVDDLPLVEPTAAVSVDFRGLYTAAGAETKLKGTMMRLHDATGERVGSVSIVKPAVGMAVLARMTAMGDPDHVARVERVVKPGPRAAAVLFADLESSSHLARRLSTAAYFSLIRHIARAADQCVIDAGGLVGTHAGDGLVAFFLTETAGSDSAAARSCIAAARAIKDAMGGVAVRGEADDEDLKVRFGLHWSAALYIGQIATGGRA